MKSNAFSKIKLKEHCLQFGFMRWCNDLMCTSHTIKDLSILREGRLDLIYKEMDVVGKNFCDDLDDNIEETNRPKFIDQRSSFFFQYEDNQGIFKAPMIHDFVV